MIIHLLPLCFWTSFWVLGFRCEVLTRVCGSLSGLKRAKSSWECWLSLDSVVSTPAAALQCLCLCPKILHSETNSLVGKQERTKCIGWIKKNRLFLFISPSSSINRPFCLQDSPLPQQKFTFFSISSFQLQSPKTNPSLSFFTVGLFLRLCHWKGSFPIDLPEVYLTPLKLNALVFADGAVWLLQRASTSAWL